MKTPSFWLVQNLSYHEGCEEILESQASPDPQNDEEFCNIYRSMKIALVHDYIKEYGGAERVLEALHEVWPEAPVYTTVYLPEFLGPHKKRFKDWDIRTSFLQYLPFREKLISPFRLIAPFVFKVFDLSKYDVVIVSATGAYSPNGLKVKSQKSKVKNTTQNSKVINVNYTLDTKRYSPIHICYCHTPPRYLYGYATARDWTKSIILHSVGVIVSHLLRLVDYKSAQNVDYFVANSKNVKERIKKFYRREATIIYPPVDVNSKFKIQNSKLQVKSQKDAYYLAGGRLARPKHIDLIVRACRELKVPLKVFGRGFAGAGKELSRHSGQARMTSPNVEFLGEVSEEEKLELMRNAKAYIFASEDEDFGITPVEAMSVGTPVIAYRSGGVVESVVEGKTGIFFDDLSVEGLKKTIIRFNKDTPYPRSILVNQARKFSKERFKREIKKFVYEKFGDARRS